MRFTLAAFGCVSLSSVLLAAPPEVVVVHPVERQIADYADSVGRTEPKAAVEIRSRVSGLIDKVNFQEGSEVKQGDLLFQLDDRVHKAEVDKAEAQVAVALATLKRSEADYQRMQQAAKAGPVSKEDVDRAQAELEVAKAGVIVAKAGAQLAKINLGYTRISSPIAGRIGRCEVSAGNFVKFDGDTPLATVVALDTLNVVFEVDERTLLRFMRFSREHKGEPVQVAISFPSLDEKPGARQASINFVDNQIDAKTGTMRLRGSLPNPKNELIAGLFASVHIPLGEPRKALLLPSSALTSTGVLVVNAKNRIEEKAVARKRQGDEYVIEEGLTLNDWVVLDVREVKVGDEVKPVRTNEIPVPDKRKEGKLAPPRQRPLSDLPGAGPAIVITAVYSGANAKVVEDTVAAPIEQQVNGVEGATQQFVTCTEEGEMRMTVSFEKGTDVNKALVLVQNRVALAEPQLPEEVRRQGIRIKKRPVFLCAIAISSPDESRNREFMGAYAEKQIRDEFLRVAGVGDCQFYGDTLPARQLRITADQLKLKALGVTPRELIDALRDQNLSVDGESSNKFDRAITLALSGRLLDADAIGDLIIKARAEGQMVRLKDVATTEMVSGFNTTAKLDGKPCIVLSISRAVDADAGQTMKQVEAKMAELVKRLPVGMSARVMAKE